MLHPMPYINCDNPAITPTWSGPMTHTFAMYDAVSCPDPTPPAAAVVTAEEEGPEEGAGTMLLVLSDAPAFSAVPTGWGSSTASIRVDAPLRPPTLPFPLPLPPAPVEADRSGEHAGAEVLESVEKRAREGKAFTRVRGGA